MWTPPMIGSTVRRWAPTITVTTAITVSCLCTFFAANNCWSVTCAPVTAMEPATPGRCWLCWSKRCASTGLACASGCGPTAACVAGKCSSWCERHGVDYLVGLAKNARLNALSAPLQAEAEAQYQATQRKVRLFGEFQYQAGSWDRSRRVIVKAEHTSKGANPRYVVTSLA